MGNYFPASIHSHGRLYTQSSELLPLLCGAPGSNLGVKALQPWTWGRATFGLKAASLATGPQLTERCTSRPVLNLSCVRQTP